MDADVRSTLKLFESLQKLATRKENVKLFTFFKYIISNINQCHNKVTLVLQSLNSNITKNKLMNTFAVYKIYRKM